MDGYNRQREILRDLGGTTPSRRLELSLTQQMESQLDMEMVNLALPVNQSITMSHHEVRSLVRVLWKQKNWVSLDLRRRELTNFGIECIAEFLSSNATLKHLYVRIGEPASVTGANKMASALEQNSTLETLIIHNPHNVETWPSTALAHVLRTNKTLSTLEFSDLSFLQSEWLTDIVPALRENQTLRRLGLSGSLGLDNHVFDSLMDIVRSNYTNLTTINLAGTAIAHRQGQLDEELRMNAQYQNGLLAGMIWKMMYQKNMEKADLSLPVTLPSRMSDDDVWSLVTALRKQENCVSVDLRRRELTDFGIECIAEFLSSNATLKNLYLSIGESASFVTGANKMASALEQNSTLKTLCFQDNLKTSGNSYVETWPSTALARVLRTNKTLSTLKFSDLSFLQSEWLTDIVPALRENQTLRRLGLSGSRGLDNDVFNSLMYILRGTYSSLTEVNLAGTDIAHRQGQLDEELRVNADYRNRLRGGIIVKRNAVRLVLCGFEYAGKTTICKSLEHSERGTPFMHRIRMFSRKVFRAYPRLRQSLFGKDSYRELASRTRGFDVVILNKNLDPRSPLRYRTTIFDFAGQKEYYCLHDYLFPETTNSYFLFVCNSRCPPDPSDLKGRVKGKSSMRDECQFWLQFIASNSKTDRGEDGTSIVQSLPQVQFVLTNVDTLDFNTRRLSTQWAESVVTELKKIFNGIINLAEIVEVVNGHSLQDVKRLIQSTNFVLKEILEKQTEYAVCKEVRNALESWCRENPSRPILNLEEFEGLCESRVLPSATDHYRAAELDSREGREAILAYFNDLGDLIYLKGLDFIVANPRWFGVGIFGNLIDAFGNAKGHGIQKDWVCSRIFDRPKGFSKLHRENGFVQRKHITDLLKHSLQMMNLYHEIPPEELIKLMIHLEMAFVKESDNHNSLLFIPAVYDDDKESAAKGKRQLKWPLQRGEDLKYLGLRMECEEKSTMILTPGFFPRLQVHLCNYIQEKAWTGNAAFEVSRNLICFAINGIEVCIEYSGDIGFFVDILVRSSKTYAESLDFIEEHVIQKIAHLCASPQGCQGTLLVKAVIRPVCVRDLHLCRDRKNQSVLVSVLKDYLNIDRAYEHTWSHTIEYEKDTDYALDLLEGEGSLKLLKGDSSAKNGGVNEAETSSSLASGSSHGGNQYLSSLLDQLPKLFYPSVKDVSILKKLNTSLSVSAFMPMKLHLFCDHDDGFHKVEGQPGRTMRLSLKAGGPDLPLAKLALTILWTGVGMGTRIAGVPGTLPPVDIWIRNLSNVPHMPGISAEALHQLTNRATTNVKISEAEIREALERYMKIHPYAEWLQEVLKLKDSSKFFEDFQLHKVIYRKGSHVGKIGWVCTEHFRRGTLTRSLEELPLTLNR